MSLKLLPDHSRNSPKYVPTRRLVIIEGRLLSNPDSGIVWMRMCDQLVHYTLGENFIQNYHLLSLAIMIVIKLCVIAYVCLFIFWLIRPLADPTYTVSSIIVCGPLQILLLILYTLGLWVFTDPIFCVFLKHGFRHAFNCSDWLCPSTFFFARHHHNTSGSLFLGTRDVARVIQVTSEYKVRNLIW